MYVPLLLSAPIVENTAFKNTNTIQQYTKPKTIDKNQDYNTSGIYRLTCNTCKMSYIGETSRNLNQRYREHIRYIRNNDPQSAHVQHILQNLHKYDLLETLCAYSNPYIRRQC